MPHIGQRIVKSAIAVFLCFAIYMFRGQGIPFYSAIAAILCMQPELNDSYEKGKSRIIATFIGGIIGMIVLYFLQTYVHEDWAWYTIISILIIPILYFTVLAKQSSSSYLSCVVFMSITVSHSQDEAVLFFAMNRILDTLIGIFVAWGVNAFHIPHYKNKNVLIEVPLSLLTNHSGTIDTHTRVHLNRCIDQGANLILSSPHTPTGLMQRIKGIHMPLSCILMDGLLKFEPQRQSCNALQVIPQKVWKNIYQNMVKEHLYPFVYEVKDEMLYVHAEPMISDDMKNIYRNTCKENGKHYVFYDVSLLEVLNRDTLAMMIAGDDEVMEKVKQILVKHQEEITWVIHPIEHKKGMYLLRIYPIIVAKQDVLEEICHTMGLLQVHKIRRKQKTSTPKQIMKQIEAVFHTKA